jgi:urease accessory protein UreF
MMVADQALLRLLQLTDTAFPTGPLHTPSGSGTYVARRAVDSAAAWSLCC